MCSGAIINSRLAEVYYGAFDPKAGAAGSVIDLFKVEKFNHHPKIYGGLFTNACARSTVKPLSGASRGSKLIRQILLLSHDKR